MPPAASPLGVFGEKLVEGVLAQQFGLQKEVPQLSQLGRALHRALHLCPAQPEKENIRVSERRGEARLSIEFAEERLLVRAVPPSSCPELLATLLATFF